mmetsp:Transcript_37512/g.87481  ORF Transcript_37512/g.87481 Transcript_37512/m.87481 type:complete len:83 (-) Transcript_37512:558-806(-)
MGSRYLSNKGEHNDETKNLPIKIILFVKYLVQCCTSRDIRENLRRCAGKDGATGVGEAAVVVVCMIAQIKENTSNPIQSIAA